MSVGLWITPEELGSDYEDLEFAQEACESASFLMWALSGRKFHGMFRVTERYCTVERTMDERFLLASNAFYALPESAYLMRGEDIGQRQIYLRGRPVRTIHAVYNVRTGEALDPSTYSAWDRAFVKFGGPLSEDIDIDYSYGSKVPSAGKMAARHMAIQFALLWSGREDECTLPERVTSVTRQNVSWTLLDNQDFIDELKTGIYTVDLFLKSVNPDKARQRAKVFSVDMIRGRRNNPRS